MAQIKTRFEIDDGYMGGSRPQSLTIDTSDFVDLPRDEVESLLDKLVEERAAEIITYSVKDRDALIEQIMEAAAKEAAEDAEEEEEE